jgi:arylsulfatase A-like enzyme
VGLFLVLLTALLTASCSRAPRSQPYIFLIVVDTLRPDHLGSYGNTVGVTPNLDRFAAEAAVFERAYAQSSWTKSSVASLLTGLYPQRHGVVGEGSLDGVLSSAATTLAEVLGEHGYETFAMSANPLITGYSGFQQGFDSFAEVRAWLRHSADETTVEVRKTLEEVKNAERAFIYIHYLDPHDPWENLPRCGAFLEGLEADPEVRKGFPYLISGESEIEDELGSGRLPVPRPLSADELAYLRGLYDCELERVDEELGRVFDRIRELGLWDRSAVVVTSDHGEEFLEHGMLRHGYQLYEETVRVPLMVRIPELAGEGFRSSEVVELVDVFPTVLSLAGIDSLKAGLDGTFLRLDRRRRPGDSGGQAFGATGFRRRDLVYLIDGSHKLIWDFTTESGRLFNLAEDPGEQQAVEPEGDSRGRLLLKEMNRRLRAAATTRLAPPQPDELPVMSQEEKNRLRALGYLQ